jgi:hypothetical protein
MFPLFKIQSQRLVFFIVVSFLLGEDEDGAGEGEWCSKDRLPSSDWTNQPHLEVEGEVEDSGLEDLEEDLGMVKEEEKGEGEEEARPRNQADLEEVEEELEEEEVVEEEVVEEEEQEEEWEARWRT